MVVGDALETAVEVVDGAAGPVGGGAAPNVVELPGNVIDTSPAVKVGIEVEDPSNVMTRPAAVNVITGEPKFLRRL
jgi:hypothetical protein